MLEVAHLYIFFLGIRMQLFTAGELDATVHWMPQFTAGDQNTTVL